MGQKQVFQSGLTDVQIWAANQTQGKEQIGTIRCENNATYKYVAFTGANAVAAGAIVNYVAFASDGSLVQVDNANTGLGAGVAMAAVAAGSAASGATYYATGWIQIEGVATVTNSPAGSPTIGQALTCVGGSAGNCKITAALTDGVIALFYGTKTICCKFPR